METVALFTYTLPRYIRKAGRLKLYLPIHYRGILKSMETETVFTEVY